MTFLSQRLRANLSSLYCPMRLQDENMQERTQESDLGDKSPPPHTPFRKVMSCLSLIFWVLCFQESHIRLSKRISRSPNCCHKTVSRLLKILDPPLARLQKQSFVEKSDGIPMTNHFFLYLTSSNSRLNWTNLWTQYWRLILIIGTNDDI